MIDKARIEEEASHFFEWPDPKRKDHVTLTSCCIFASTIAEMVRAEERERFAAKLAQAEYLIAAWERGALATDYYRDIADFRA